MKKKICQVFDNIPFCETTFSYLIVIRNLKLSGKSKNSEIKRIYLLVLFQLIKYGI